MLYYVFFIFIIFIISLLNSLLQYRRTEQDLCKLWMPPCLEIVE